MTNKTIYEVAPRVRSIDSDQLKPHGNRIATTTTKKVPQVTLRTLRLGPDGQPVSLTIEELKKIVNGRIRRAKAMKSSTVKKRSKRRLLIPGA